MKSSFNGTLYMDVPVHLFVEIVWGIDEAHSQKIINATFELREEPPLGYMQVLNPEKIFVELNRFKNIWKAQSVAEFKNVFLDCLDCKHKL